MSMIEKLRAAGSEISHSCAQFDNNLTETEFWMKKDSPAFREILAILISLHPDLRMRNLFGSPQSSIEKRGPTLWTSPDFTPYVRVRLDSRDCPEFNTGAFMPLRSLLSKIQDHGLTNAMAVRVALDGATRDRVLSLADSECERSS